MLAQAMVFAKHSNSMVRKTVALKCVTVLKGGLTLIALREHAHMISHGQILLTEVGTSTLIRNAPTGVYVIDQWESVSVLMDS